MTEFEDNKEDGNKIENSIDLSSEEQSGEEKKENSEEEDDSDEKGQMTEESEEIEEIESHSNFSKEEIEYLENIKLHERTQLLFGILYLANRTVANSDLDPLIKFQKETFEEKKLTIERLVTELNEELNSRSAPYTVVYRFNNEHLELVLKQEYIRDLSFSEHFTKQENISREKLKIISFITFKNYLEHSACYSQDLMLNKSLDFDEIKLSNILYELEQKDGLIFQDKNKQTGKIELQLTNQFFDMMNLPKDKFQLGPILRNQLMKVIDGDVSTYISEENSN